MLNSCAIARAASSSLGSTSPRIRISCPNRSVASMSSGISRRQGGHQEAQKLSTNGVPSLSHAIGSPLYRSYTSNAGARCPSKGPSAVARASGLGVGDSQIQPIPSMRTAMVATYQKILALRGGSPMRVMPTILFTPNQNGTYLRGQYADRCGLQTSRAAPESDWQVTGHYGRHHNRLG